MERAQVGDVEIVALSDGSDTYPAGDVFPDHLDELEAVRGLLTADGGVTLNFGCFLLRADGRTLLVDTGNGPEAQGALLDELSAAGVAADEVDAVLFTHLHGDHTGWNLDRESGKPLFAKARYLVPRGDWDHYAGQDERPASFVRDVLPLEGLGVLDLFEGEHALSASLTAFPTPGHTPGHTSVAIASLGAHGLIIGDAVITVVDAAHPDWHNAWDGDHAVAAATRRSLLRRATDAAALVGASHLPPPGLGRFEASDGAHVWLPS